MFTWDDAKNEANIRTRGLPFALAEILFEGPVIEFPDTRFDYGEERILAFGKIADRLFVCVYTQRGEARHIISLRKANEREVRRYGW